MPNALKSTLADVLSDIIERLKAPLIVVVALVLVVLRETPQGGPHCRLLVSIVASAAIIIAPAHDPLNAFPANDM